MVAPDTGHLLGLDHAAAIALTRGILVVEGEHDRRVIKAFFGTDVTSARVRILPIRGTENALSLAEAELYSLLGVRLCVLFDEARDASLTVDPPPKLTPEERKIKQLLDHAQGAGFPITHAPFYLPDMVAALPEAAVRRAFPDSPFTGWQPIVDAWRAKAENRPGFKAYALKRLHLRQLDPDSFVDRVLASVAPGDETARELTLAVKTSLAQLGGTTVDEKDHSGTT